MDSYQFFANYGAVLKKTFFWQLWCAFGFCIEATHLSAGVMSGHGVIVTTRYLSWLCNDSFSAFYFSGFVVDWADYYFLYMIMDFLFYVWCLRQWENSLFWLNCADTRIKSQIFKSCVIRSKVVLLLLCLVFFINDSYLITC